MCGPDGCTAVADVAVAPILGNGGPPRTPPTAAPYYDVRITMAEGDQNATWSFAAVPARHAMRADDGTWMQMAPDASALVTKTAAGRKPYPASEMVGWAAAPDPKPEPASTDSPLTRVCLVAGGRDRRPDRAGRRVRRPRRVAQRRCAASVNLRGFVP